MGVLIQYHSCSLLNAGSRLKMARAAFKTIIFQITTNFILYINFHIYNQLRHALYFFVILSFYTFQSNYSIFHSIHLN
jgi:hypothetical protein